MLQSRFVPNFEPLSITSVILGINIIVFIIIHIAFSPPSYEVFLKFPTEMGDWALNV